MPLRDRVHAHPGVMTRGNLFRPQAHGVIEEGLELDFGVAQDVGVGRAAHLVFAQELGEHAVLVFGGEIDVFDLDAEHVGHRCGIDEIDIGRTVFRVVVIFPVLHEEGDDVKPLLFQQPGRDRGVHSAAESHHHAPAGLLVHNLRIILVESTQVPTLASLTTRSRG